MNNLGVLFRRMHDADQAVSCFEQALDGCEEPWLRGRIFSNWAVLEHRRGQLTVARRCYQDALNCCSEPPEDELAVARICLNFAWLHLQQDRQVQADTLLKRARLLVQQHPEDSLLECRLHLGLARSAQVQKRLAKAEIEILQAIRVAQKLGYFEPIVHSQARARLADCYSLQALGQLDNPDTVKDGQERSQQAEILFSEALSILVDWGHRHSFEYVETLSLQVDHWVRTRQWHPADESLQRLLAMVTEMTTLETTFKARAWERAALVLRQLEQFELADLATQQFQALTLGKK
jgi:tetratricopeptide (TPR) repeat protein